MAYTERYVCNHEWNTTTIDETTKKEKTIHHVCNVEADDAHEDLDIEAIVAACDAIAEQASGLESIDRMVKVYTSNITKDDLCVNETTVEGISNDCHTYVAEQIKAIKDHVADVKEKAIDTFNDRQKAYNDIAREKCRQIHG